MRVNLFLACCVQEKRWIVDTARVQATEHDYREVGHQTWFPWT
jgi:hypothetical protein